MAEYPSLTLTLAGIEMIAESQATGTKLIITNAKIGDGTLADSADIEAMTDIIASKLVAPLSNYENLGNGELHVAFAISNATVESGFFAREIGIFAMLEDGTEKLYAYANAGLKCDWIPSKSTPIDSQVVDARLVIGNAENVTVMVTDDAFALARDFLAHEVADDAHENRFSQYVKCSGDVMTAKRAMVRDVNNSNIFICGGKDEFSGAYLQAYGADEENSGGAFVLAANNDTNSSMLKGYPDGELTWGNTLKFSSKHGGYIHREAPVSMWFNGRDYAMLQQKSLPDEGYGALYSLKTNSGSWECGACNYNKDNLIFTFIDDEKYNLASAEEDSGVVPAENNAPKMQFLFGTDGSLKWRDSANGVEKFFVTGINGVNADINGNVDLIPAGTMQMFAGNTIPAGWLLCDGSAVSRTDYAKLFSAIGTTWGEGDGSTTFNLPNSIGRFAEGAATAGKYIGAGLPNIYGQIGFGYRCGNYDSLRLANGAFAGLGDGGCEYSGNGGASTALATADFNAARSSGVYGASSTVQPPALTMLPIIKY